MSSAPSQFRSGVALAVGGTFLFALKSIFIKLAFAEGATPVPLLAIRMMLALPFYLLVLWRLRLDDTAPVTKMSSRKRATWYAWSASLGFLGYYLASFLDLSGLALITAQLERLTLFTYPAMVSLLAWMFLGERLHGRMVAAIALSYVGIFTMYQGERATLAGERVGLGVLLVLGSALSYSLYILFAKPTMQVLGSRRFTSLAMIGSTGFVILHAVIVGAWHQLVTLPPVVFGYGLVLAFVCTVLPSFMINEAIVRLGATRTTVIGSAGPVFTMALAVLWLGEPTSGPHLLGTLLVIAGISLVAKRERPVPRRAPAVEAVR